jgi:hypothetical protein
MKFELMTSFFPKDNAFPTKRKGKLPAGIPLFPKLLPVINLYIFISF